MTTPRLRCPHCQARITVLNPERLPRAVNCPRCRRSFATIEDPAPSWGGGPEAKDETLPGLLPSSLSFWLIGGGGLALLVAVVAGAWLLFREGNEPQRRSSKSSVEQRADSDNGARSSVLDQRAAKKEPKPSASRGKLALLVGVRDYDSARLAQLKYPENDVEELAQIIDRPDSAFASVRLLTTSRGKSRPEDAPTAKNIRAAVASLLAGRKRDDLVLIALSGHGVAITDETTKKDHSYFCPSDAQLNDRASLLNLSDLFKQLDESGAGAKLLLVDACRDEPHETRSLDADSIPRPPRGVAALFSCSSGERAFETAKLGRGHGVFFYHVLEGLRGKALDEEKEVSWARLTEYVTKQVSRTVPLVIGGGARQTPHLVTNLMGNSPVLVRAGARWQIRLAEGREKLEKHQYAQAIEALDEAAQLAPAESAPVAYRALAHSHRGKPTEALADCDKALTLNPRSAVALAVRGRVQATRGQSEKALADADEAVRQDPKSALALCSRAFARLRKGETDLALADAEAALLVAPNSADAYNERGSVRYARKEYAAAISNYDEAIRLAPGFAAAFTNRGNARLAAGEIDQAIADFDEAIRLDPKSASAYHNRGAAYTRKKDYPRALTDLGEAIRLDPLDAMTHHNRGLVHAQQADYDKAIADLSEAIKIDPKAGMPYNDRGAAYAGKKDYDRAIADYGEAIKRLPEAAGAYRNRGLAYQEKGDFEKALADYTIAVKLEPKYAAIYYYRGAAYGRLKKLDEAIAEFTEAIRLDPTMAWAYNDRGVAYGAKKQFDQAIADHTRAIELDRQYALAFQNRGVAYVNKGRYDLAIEDFSEAIRLAPDFAAPYLHRSNAHKALKDFAASKRDYDTYLKRIAKR